MKVPESLRYAWVFRSILGTSFSIFYFTSLVGYLNSNSLSLFPSGLLFILLPFPPEVASRNDSTHAIFWHRYFTLLSHKASALWQLQYWK